MDKKRVQKTVAVLLTVLFIVTLTATVISATPTLPLPPPYHSILYGWGGWGGWGVLR